MKRRKEPAVFQLLGLDPEPAEPPKKLDAKEIMKQRREKAICIVSIKNIKFNNNKKTLYLYFFSFVGFLT
jgi:hypothetical protein